MFLSEMLKMASWACMTNPFLALVVELDGFRKFTNPLPPPIFNLSDLFLCIYVLLAVFFLDLYALLCGTMQQFFTLGTIIIRTQGSDQGLLRLQLL